MSLGKMFDTIKDGMEDAVGGIKNAYAPGKLGTITKLVLTAVAILAIFWVVGKIGEDDAG